MHLWLTLLLAWTTGIPAAICMAAEFAARLHERRVAQFTGLPRGRALRPAIERPCSRREHRHGRARATSRRPA